MADVGELPKTVSGIIPNFFFDAIGRIVPGTYLVAGVLWVRHVSSIGGFLKDVSGATVPALIAFALGLIALGYLAGFLLAAVSHWLESVMRRFNPWTLAMLRQRFGESEDQESRLERVFREQFGLGIINDHDKIVYCSWLCSFFVWSRDAHLGSMGARWDAEALADRSIATASLIIAITVFFVPHWCDGTYYWLMLLVLLAAFAASVVNYRYRRMQRVLGRFQLFVSLTPETAPRRQQTAEPGGKTV